MLALDYFDDQVGGARVAVLYDDDDVYTGGRFFYSNSRVKKVKSSKKEKGTGR